MMTHYLHARDIYGDRRSIHYLPIFTRLCSPLLSLTFPSMSRLKFNTNHRYRSNCMTCVPILHVIEIGFKTCSLRLISDEGLAEQNAWATLCGLKERITCRISMFRSALERSPSRSHATKLEAQWEVRRLYSGKLSRADFFTFF